MSGTYGMYKKKNAFRVLVEKTYGNRPLGRPGLSWDIQIHLT